MSSTTIRGNRLISATFAIVSCITCATLADTPLPIIPGAHGFGMDTPAGSGRHLAVPKTKIVKVTNLNDAGPGSLRDALEGLSGARTIIFEISGNIALESPITIGSRDAEDARGQYLTIAGQTAPQPGITIMHYGFRIEANSHDILIQHLRVRPGDTSIGGILNGEWTRVDSATGSVYSHPVRVRPNRGWGSGVGVTWKGDPLTEAAGKRQDVQMNEWDWNDATLYVNVGDKPAAGQIVWIPAKTSISDPLTLSDKLPSPHHIVVDHCSFSWGGDMTVQNGANEATFLNNILTEALNHPRHPKGPHSKGFYNLSYNKGKSGGQRVAFIKNLISHCVDRNPAISSGSAIVANNFLYDLGRGEDASGKDHGIRVEDTNVRKGPVAISVVANAVERSDRVPSLQPISCRSRYDLGSKFYIAEDNTVDGRRITDPWNNSLVNQQYPWPTYAPVPAVKRATTRYEAIWLQDYEPMPVAVVKQHVLVNAGARPAERDPVDSRVIENVNNRVSHILVSQKDVGGWPDLAENRRELTLPDDPGGDDDGDGYTNLEEWLHNFAAQVEGRGD